MTKKFRVELPVTGVCIFRIEAESESEALDKAEAEFVRNNPQDLEFEVGRDFRRGRWVEEIGWID